MATTGVTVLVAVAVPTLLDAVTATRIVFPTSAAESIRVLEVAPEMVVHSAPDALHRCHAYVRAGTG